MGGMNWRRVHTEKAASRYGAEYTKSGGVIGPQDSANRSYGYHDFMHQVAWWLSKNSVWAPADIATACKMTENQVIQISKMRSCGDVNLNEKVVSPEVFQLPYKGTKFYLQ